MDPGGQTVAKWESRALRGCRLVGQGVSPATGASPVGRGPLVPAGRRPPGWTSCDPGPPKAGASSPVAGQVSTRPGRADQLRPRRPRLAPGTRRHSAASLRLPAPSGPVPLCPGPELHPSWRALGWAHLSLCQDPAQKPPRPPPEAPGGVPSSGLLALFGLCSRLPGGCPGPLPAPSPTAGTSRASCFSFCDATSVGATRLGPGLERGLVRKGEGIRRVSGRGRACPLDPPIQDRTRLSSGARPLP